MSNGEDLSEDNVSLHGITQFIHVEVQIHSVPKGWQLPLREWRSGGFEYEVV